LKFSTHHNKSGFSLIEIMVVVVIIAIMATVMVPNFRRATPDQERAKVITSLNELMQGAWQNATSNDKLQKIEFNFDRQAVKLTQAQKMGLTVDDDQKFEPVGENVIISEVKWPEYYRIINFYIEGRDQMRLGSRDTAWFYVVPDGLAQQVVINFIDEKASEDSDIPVKVGLVLNPFYVQFKEFYEFQQP